MAAEKIKDDLNNQVRKWGIDIREVTLSEPRLLKKPDEKSALAPVLQNLGLKDEQEFPSPEQFVRGNYNQKTSDESDAEALNKVTDIFTFLFFLLIFVSYLFMFPNIRRTMNIYIYEYLLQLASAVGGMLTKGKGEAGGMDLGTMASMMSSLGTAGARVQVSCDWRRAGHHAHL